MTHLTITRASNYKDPLVNKLARDTERALESIQDITVHIVEALWDVPAVLDVPFSDGTSRKAAPLVVRCDRAVDLDAGSATTPGGMSWDWIDGAVQIAAVDGLTLGTRYRLTFTAIGQEDAQKDAANPHYRLR